MLLKELWEVEHIVPSGGIGHRMVDLQRLINQLHFQWQTVQIELLPEKCSSSLLLCKLLHDILLV